MLSLSKYFTGVGAIKLATPSPDGQWMAICPDKSSRVLIISVVSAVHSCCGRATYALRF